MTPRGIGSAIDVVADMQQQRCRDRAGGQILGDDCVQVAELRVAAVDVADGVDAAAGRQRCGGGGEVDHHDELEWDQGGWNRVYLARSSRPSRAKSATASRRGSYRQHWQHHPARPIGIDEHGVHRDAPPPRQTLRLAGVRVDVELRKIADDTSSRMRWPGRNRLAVGNSVMRMRVTSPGRRRRGLRRVLGVAQPDDPVGQDHRVAARIVGGGRMHVDQLGGEVGVGPVGGDRTARPRSARRSAPARATARSGTPARRGATPAAGRAACNRRSPALRPGPSCRRRPPAPGC